MPEDCHKLSTLLRGTGWRSKERMTQRGIQEKMEKTSIRVKSTKANINRKESDRDLEKLQ